MLTRNMAHIKRLVNPALLLSVFLSACLGNPQPATETPIPPAVAPPTVSLTSVQSIFHLDTSALSYGIFETDATSVTVEVSNTLPEELSAFADISIGDGNDVTTYKVEPGESMIVHSLPLGEKRVTITSGGQTKSSNGIAGVFIPRIIFNGSALQIKQDAKQIVVYGDSLTVGGSVDNLSAEAWPVLLRKHYSVIVEAYSYRSLYDDASTPAKIAELASKISAWTPDYIWLAIGTNDYGQWRWPAAEFGEAYAATLDALHSSNPRALLFAQSPILKAGEFANQLGDDLESYRQEISAACLARAVWCVFVDGTDTAFPQPNELYKDGLHLTTESSAKYAEAVRNIIAKPR